MQVVLPPTTCSLSTTRPTAKLRRLDSTSPRSQIANTRFDAAGKVVEKARVTVYQNETLIHEDAEIKGPTGIHYEQYKGEAPKGPIVLQGDHGTVQFRNVWLVPAKY